MVHEVDQSGGDAWGDDIDDKRKAKLEAQLQAWEHESHHGKRRGPFDKPRNLLQLTGADVFWLAATLAATSENLAVAGQLEEPSLAELHLEGAYLVGAHLEGATLDVTHLEGANLNGAHLEGTWLFEAHLEGANLNGAHLEGAWLSEAHLEGTSLHGAHLEGASLVEAHLEGADLNGAHLEGKRFLKDDEEFVRIHSRKPDFPPVLPPCDLRLAFFDRATQLEGATFGNAKLGVARVADTHWGDVNLAVVDWGNAPILHDEHTAIEWKAPQLEPTNKPLRWQQRRSARKEQRAQRLYLYRAAARANRQLATVLRTQGLNDEADHFAYRAQLLQRTVFWQQLAWGRAFFSSLMDLVAGYGYRPRRSLITYVVTIGIFALLYWAVTNDVSLTHGLFTHAVTLLGMRPPPPSHEHLQGYEAVVVSMTSFHGRGFFQPIESPGDKVAILAAIEAAVGLLIEITFIATFTQRFLAR